ncbi:MAG: hypothetical protein WBG48_01470 [Pricia sp.]
MKEQHKKYPFKTPEGYFENFYDRLKKKLSKDDGSIPEADGFIAPEGYFEGLHQNILQKLNVEEVKVIPLYRYKRYYFAAASVAAIVLLVFTFNRNTSEEVTFEDLALTDIENYFEYNHSDFSPFEIAEVVPVDELEIADLMTNTLNDDSILNYLDNNTDEFEELNLEYDEQH